MKKIIMTALVSALALITVQAKDLTSIESCKTYINEAKSYQATMKSDKVSEATLAFYKDNVVAHCGNIASKMPYKKDFFAQALMKKETTTVSNCKTAIKMAKSYKNIDDKFDFITQAHKVNVVDNCGTLIAKKAPSFCQFDVVDNSKADLKARCLASIKKAHKATNTEARNTYKDEVVSNCGRLQARI